MFNTPIFINNLNRLTTTKKLVEDLQKLGYYDITILDNNSTYAPLLEWYRKSPVKVLPLGRNFGQLAIYNCGILNEITNEWVAYSDSDIELNPRTPIGFLETMIQKARQYGSPKAGLALKLEDLPDNEFSRIFQDWEAKFWENELEPNIYRAHVDTTFCVIKKDHPFTYESLRFAGDFTSKHIPWYTDFGNLCEEEKYYLDNVSIEFSGYKRYYNKYLLNPS